MQASVPEPTQGAAPAGAETLEAAGEGLETFLPGKNMQGGQRPVSADTDHHTQGPPGRPAGRAQQQCLPHAFVETTLSAL